VKEDDADRSIGLSVIEVRRRATRRLMRPGAVLATATLLALAAVFLVPFLWLIVTALKDSSELSALPVRLWPRRAEWGNFTQAVTLINYGRYALNSFVLAATFAGLTLITSALVGFGFARLRGRGKNLLFLVMLSTLMLPPIITVIPTYMIFARLGLIYTYWPWVFWGLSASAFLSFLFRQFFAGIPLDLEDAAIVDGCGYGRIFLPLSKPVIATVFIIAFQSVWDDYFTPSIFLNADNITLAVALAQGYLIPNSSVPLTNVLSAGALLYTLPVVVLFFAAQRYFVQGIVTTGLKG